MYVMSPKIYKKKLKVLFQYFFGRKDNPEVQQLLQLQLFENAKKNESTTRPMEIVKEKYLTISIRKSVGERGNGFNNLNYAQNVH